VIDAVYVVVEVQATTEPVVHAVFEREQDAEDLAERKRNSSIHGQYVRVYENQIQKAGERDE